MVQAAGDSKPVLPKQSLTLCQTQELRTAGCYRLLLAQHTPHPTAVPYDTEFRIQIRKIVRYEVPGMIQQQYGTRVQRETKMPNGRRKTHQL